MTEDRRRDVMLRITPQAPVSLDAVLAPFDPLSAKPGRVFFAANTGQDISGKLFEPIDAICFGVRVTAPIANLTSFAMKIARMAYERDAEPIILSHIGGSGLERFGFRVERVAGTTPAEREACERELAQFWNIVMVI